MAEKNSTKNKKYQRLKAQHPRRYLDDVKDKILELQEKQWKFWPEEISEMGNLRLARKYL